MLLLVPVLVYANTLRNAYHLDDFPRIVENPEIERLWPPWRHFLDPASSSVLPFVVQYRPLLPLSLSLDHAVARALGVDRLPVFHATNVILHATIVVLLYLLFCEIQRAATRGPPGPRERDLALLAALLYAVHPVAGVPVNYLVGRDLLLMQMFLLAGLLSYLKVRARPAPGWRWAIPPALCTLSILSKTNAVAAPLVVFLLELTVGRCRLTDARPWVRSLPFAAVAIGFFAVTRLLHFSDTGQLFVDRPPLEYPLTQLRLHVVHYLRNAFWPLRLRLLPDLEPAQGIGDPGVLAGLALVAASAAAVWHLRHRAPLVAFAIGAYWLVFLPTSSVLPFRILGADYRQVPSLPWLAFLVAGGLARIPAARLRIPCGAALVGTLAVLSFSINRTWRTEESLWGRSVALGGTSVAHHNYARAIMGRDPVLAERHFRETLRRDPGDVRARINLGLLLMREGRSQEGLEIVRRAVELAPEWGLTHYWWAIAQERAGDYEGAARSSARAAELVPRDPRFLYQAAWDAYLVRDYESVLRYLEPLHALRSEMEQSRFLEGFALQQLGRTAEAIDVYRGFLARHPEHVTVRYNLALAYAGAGRCADAIPELERVLALAPDHAGARAHLERCRAQGQPPAKTGDDAP